MRVHSSVPADATPPPSDVRVCVCVRARVHMCVVCLVHDVCMYMCICESVQIGAHSTSPVCAVCLVCNVCM